MYSPKESKQRIVDSDGDGDGTVGISKPTKPQPSQKRPNAERISEMKLASGNVSTLQFVVFGSFPCVLTVSSQKSESEISVLFDDEPPKRQRKTKGEKDETVRGAFLIILSEGEF